MVDLHSRSAGHVAMADIGIADIVGTAGGGMFEAESGIAAVQVVVGNPSAEMTRNYSAVEGGHHRSLHCCILESQTWKYSDAILRQRSGGYAG